MAVGKNAEEVSLKGGMRKSLVRLIKKHIFEGDGWMNLRGAYELDEAGQPTGRKVNVRVKIDNAQAFVVAYGKAMMTNPVIMKDALDRIDGKPVQTIVGKLEHDTGGADLEKRIKSIQADLAALNGGTAAGEVIEILPIEEGESGPPQG